jgi:hypothetical protein
MRVASGEGRCMSHLRVRFQRVLTVVSGGLVLVQLLQAQPQQSATPTPKSDGQGLQANAPSSVSVTEPFSVVTSNGTWVNQAGIPTSPVRPLPFTGWDLLGYGYGILTNPDSPSSWIPFNFPTDGAVVYEGGKLVFTWVGLGATAIIMLTPSPLGCAASEGCEGLPPMCYSCPPYQEPGSGPVLLNVPTGTPSSSSGIVIESQLVSSPPAPVNGISIETQAVPNPSNDGIEAEAPKIPISIESSMSPDSPSIAPETGSPMGNSTSIPATGGGASGSGGNGWSTFFSALETAGQVINLAIQTCQGFGSCQPQHPVATYPPLGAGSTPSVSTAGTSRKPNSPTPSSGICPAGYHQNPAVLACLTAPFLSNGLPNYCDHVGGDPSAPYIPTCLSN